MTRQSKLTQDKPKVTVTYPEDVDSATVRVSGDGVEPVTKKLDFTKGEDQGGKKPDQDQGQQKPDDGQDQKPDQGQQPPKQDERQIQIKATQDPKDPHLITLKALKFPPKTDKLLIDWGVQQVGNTPKELTKEKPEVSVKFSPKTKRVTVTVDDEDNPDTKPWVHAFKIAPQEDGQQGGQQQNPDQGGQSGGSSGGSGSGKGSGSGESGGHAMSDQTGGGQGGSQGQSGGGESGSSKSGGSSGGSQ